MKSNSKLWPLNVKAVLTEQVQTQQVEVQQHGDKWDNIVSVVSVVGLIALAAAAAFKLL